MNYELINQLDSLNKEVIKTQELIKRYVHMNQVKNTYIILKAEIPIVLYELYSGDWYSIIGVRIEKVSNEAAHDLLKP